MDNKWTSIYLILVQRMGREGAMEIQKSLINIRWVGRQVNNFIQSFKKYLLCPNWHGSVDWASSCKLKGCWFGSDQCTCLGCGPGPLLEAWEKQPIDVSLPLFLPPFPLSKNK